MTAFDSDTSSLNFGLVASFNRRCTSMDERREEGR
jgi:hypothetical protein